jgi:two-component system, cell cycle sensor histidine kinase and response regulator CckA
MRDMTGMLERIIGEDIELLMFASASSDTVIGDRGQLEQVVLNLATNARDAMPNGGRLTMSSRHVTVGASMTAFEDDGLLPDDYIVLEVTDTGVGMDEATQARILEPFFTTKEPGRGTGLGLSTVYGIVRDHGGYLKVSSKPGRGSTFRIFLPRRHGMDATIEQEQAIAHAPSGTETVLIVEDNESLRTLIDEVLRHASYSTIVCRDGEEALERARSEDQFQAVLLDLVLPRVSGMDLIEELRVLRPEARVLMMSGYTEDTSMSGPRVLDEQVPYIQKPFSLQQLCVRLRQVLDAPLPV